jgi:hypothetical protein
MAIDALATRDAASSVEVMNARVLVVRGLFAIVSALLLRVHVPCVAAADAKETPNAAEILERVTKAYATAASYRDEGMVLMHDSSKPGPDVIKFSTAFERPTRFRFEWTSHHPHPPLRHLLTQAAVWRDTEGTFSSRRNPDGKETVDARRTLSEGIAAATGVSRASSHHIPRLLLPEVSGAAVTDLQNPVLRGTAQVEGVACHHIAGERLRGGLLELWIGKEDLMIRRIKRTLNGLDVEEIRRGVQVGR